MVQKRGTKAINKLCVREILALSFVCGAYFFEFCGWKQGRYACALPFSRVPVTLTANFNEGFRWVSHLVGKLVYKNLLTTTDK